MLQQIIKYAPDAVAGLGAVVVLITALQAAFTTAQALFTFLAKFWPGASVIASLMQSVARVLGVVAIDVQQVIGYVQKALGLMGKRPPLPPVVSGIVFLIAATFLCGCSPAQTAHDVQVACQTFEKDKTVADILAELVDLTDIPASDVVADVNAYCQTFGIEQAKRYLTGKLTSARAARAKAMHAGGQVSGDAGAP